MMREQAGRGRQAQVLAYMHLPEGQIRETAIEALLLCFLVAEGHSSRRRSRKPEMFALDWNSLSRNRLNPTGTRLCKDNVPVRSCCLRQPLLAQTHTPTVSSVSFVI